MASPTNHSTAGPSKGNPDAEATIATFSPSQPSRSARRKIVVVGQKSPLLIATPPEITRALAFSHPFLLPLNQALGLITWSSGDPWESFLLVVAFWVVVLYGAVAIQWAGPVLLIAGLIGGMYSRRYSPLSTRGLVGGVFNKGGETAGVKQQKSLDEIVEVLNEYTARCELLMDPLLQLTDFLSIQQSATSATTRPALTSMFLRILMVLPLWLAMTLPPLRLLTIRHIILVSGTLFLTWYSRPARVSRTLLWRSMTVRYLASLITGLTFSDSAPGPNQASTVPPRNKDQQIDVANSLASSGSLSRAGVRFTFVLYENQRRWLGLGWTSSLFAYERAPWTDEHLNATSSKDEFSLPTVDGAGAAWKWVSGSTWHIETSSSKSSTSSSSRGTNEGWIFHDNKWNDGRRTDGWGRYTRRRKWYRDAELVDCAVSTSSNPSELEAVETSTWTTSATAALNPSTPSTPPDSESQTRKRGFLRRESRGSAKSSARAEKIAERGVSEDDEQEMQGMDVSRMETEGLWRMGDEMKMGLG